MNAQAFIRDRLKQKLVEAKSKNASVSIRSFSKKLGLSAATVSLVMLGKRPVSKKLALKLAQALQFSKLESDRVLSQISQEAERGPKDASSVTSKNSPHQKSKDIQINYKPESISLSEDQFDLLKEWYFFGILSLVQTADFQLDPKWIAVRLGILERQAKEALDVLFHLHLLKFDENKKVIRGYEVIRTSDGKRSSSLRHAHHQNLELARRVLARSEMNDFDFTWINLPVDIQRLPEMRAMIRRFEEEFLEKFVQKETANEVSRVCVQAFPVTSRTNKAS